jgi:flagellar basal-body rod protein FlgB
MGPIDSALGVSPQVLALRAQRMELLSANLANADTPGYKARDLDFAGAMQAAGAEQSALRRTDSRHLSPAAGLSATGEPMYRIPAQPTMDGNTVETQREHAEFMNNAVRYQASLNFLDGRIKTLQTAIRGQS